MATITVTDVPEELEIKGDKITMRRFISRYTEFVDKMQDEEDFNLVKKSLNKIDKKFYSLDSLEKEYGI